jgi:hypothetical protein
LGKLADIGQKLLKKQGYTELDWPQYSPDLIPIEIQWFRLRHGISSLTVTIMELRGDENQKGLLAIEVASVWNRIPAANFAKVIAAIQKRCKAIIQAGGGHTKYHFAKFIL